MAGADSPAAPASAADEAPRAGRPVRLVLLMAGTWLAAVLSARLLLAGGALWVLFAALLPIALLVLGRLLGFGVALLLTGFFVAATLAMRLLLTTPQVGWSLLLLAPVLALSAFVALRVVTALRAPRGG